MIVHFHDNASKDRFMDRCVLEIHDLLVAETPASITISYPLIHENWASDLLALIYKIED